MLRNNKEQKFQFEFDFVCIIKIGKSLKSLQIKNRTHITKNEYNFYDFIK